MLADDDIQSVQKLNDAYRRLVAELGHVIVGQQHVIEELLIAMFARGHCLLVGVPGLAKTLLIRTLADTLSLKFSRIQFTPDLMPSDITGTEVIQEDKATGARHSNFLPVRSLPMSFWRTKSIARRPRRRPRCWKRCKNTRSRSAAQRTDWPNRSSCWPRKTRSSRKEPIRCPRHSSTASCSTSSSTIRTRRKSSRSFAARRPTWPPTLETTLAADEILALQEIVRRVPVADHVARYALQFTRLTRREKGRRPDFINEYVSWGAGPRASQYLVLGAKARAVLHGRYHAKCEDVRAVVAPVLRHRIVTNFNAEAEGIKPDDIIRRLIDVVPESDWRPPPVDEYQKYLDPQMLAKLHGLELRAG